MSSVVPIASLRPAITPPSTGSIRAIVTLYWPYSTLSKQCALLLADPDFRLRNKSGQIRVRFRGPSAELVAKSNISIGDEVTLDLDGAVWAGTSAGVISTPGKSVDGELEFKDTLGLQIAGRGSNGVVRVRSVSSTAEKSGDYQRNTAQTPIKPFAAFHNGHNEPVEDIPAHVYESPAFARRLKLSGEQYLDAAYDPFVDPDFHDGQGRHKRRKIMWRYLDGSQSPSDQSENDVGESEQDFQLNETSKTVWASEPPRTDFESLSIPQPTSLLERVGSGAHLSPTLRIRQVEEVDSSPPLSGSNTPLATKLHEASSLVSGPSLSEALMSETTTGLSHQRPKSPHVEMLTVPLVREEQAQDQLRIKRQRSPSSFKEIRPLDGGNQSNHPIPAQSSTTLDDELAESVSGSIATRGEEAAGTKYQVGSKHSERPFAQGTRPDAVYSDRTDTHDSTPAVNDNTTTPATSLEESHRSRMSDQEIGTAGAHMDLLDSAFLDTISGYQHDAQILKGEEEITGFSTNTPHTIIASKLGAGRTIEAPASIPLTQSAFGFDGAWSDIAATPQVPGVASSDKVMTETYRSLFGFQENEPVKRNTADEASLKKPEHERIFHQNQVDFEMKPDDIFSINSLDGIVKPSANTTTTTAENVIGLDLTQVSEAGTDDLTFPTEHTTSNTDVERVELLGAGRHHQVPTQNQKEELESVSFFDPAAHDIGEPRIVQQAVERVASQIPSQIPVYLSPEDQQEQQIQRESHDESQTRSTALAQPMHESHRESSDPSVAHSSDLMVEELDKGAASEHISKPSRTIRELNLRPDVPSVVDDDQHHEPYHSRRTLDLDSLSSPIEPQGAAVIQAPLDDSIHRLDQTQPTSANIELVSNMSEEYARRSAGSAADIGSQSSGSNYNDRRPDRQRSNAIHVVDLTLRDHGPEDESFSLFRPTEKYVEHLSERNQAASGSADLVEEELQEHESITKVAVVMTEPELGDRVNPLLHISQDLLPHVLSLGDSDSPGQVLELNSDTAEVPSMERRHTPSANASPPMIEEPNPVGLSSPKPVEQEYTTRSSAGTADMGSADTMIDSREHPHPIKNDTSNEQATDSLLSNIAAHQHLRTPTVKTIAGAKQSVRRSTAADDSSSRKERPSVRKAIPARLSQVPEVISSWFSPRRSSRLTTEGEKELAEPRIDADEKQEHRKHSRRSTATGIATSYSYFTPLSNIEQKLNPPSQSYSNDLIDIIGVATQDTETPQRAKKGPRDFFIRVLVKDPSLDGEEGAVIAEVYRPWHAQLPIALAGDVVLLRGFAVKSRKRQPYLLSTDSSAWCVWRFAENALDDDEAREKTPWAHRLRAGSFSGVREEVKGPPVELGEEERIRAEELHGWWQGLQELAAEANDA